MRSCRKASSVACFCEGVIQRIRIEGFRPDRFELKDVPYARILSVFVVKSSSLGHPRCPEPVIGEDDRRKDGIKAADGVPLRPRIHSAVQCHTFLAGAREFTTSPPKGPEF